MAGSEHTVRGCSSHTVTFEVFMKTISLLENDRKKARAERTKRQMNQKEGKALNNETEFPP